MIRDIRVVMWKEWKELLRLHGKRGKFQLLMPLGIIGIFFPLSFGRMWVESPMMLFLWTWVALTPVIMVVCDSFAGERERHTLETLLASRLPDRAILFGKLLAAIGYGWGSTLVFVLISLVTVNLRHGKEGLLFYSPSMAVGITLMSLLGAGMAASAGVLASLRASTVRQAQQTMTIIIMSLFFAPFLAFVALPHSLKANLIALIKEAGTAWIVAAAFAVLAILNVGLLAGALARFKRARLILE